MIIDNSFNFASAQALTGNAASTNVFDAGSAKTLFAGHGNVRVAVDLSAIASTGSDYTFRVQLIGATDAALTGTPEILADSGATTAGLPAAGNIPAHLELTPMGQRVAKRYYGLLFTLGGTSPTATVSGNLVLDAQSAMLK